MVYLHFPPNLTEEELNLQSQYDKLKRKRKILQDLKTSKPKLKSPQTWKNAAEARRIAEKLVKSGAITIKPVKPPKQSQRRPVCLKRKLNNTDDINSVHQHSNTTQLHEGESKPKKPFIIENEYKNVIPFSVGTEIVSGNNIIPTTIANKKKNTILVLGYNMSESFLKEHFLAFGIIHRIIIEGEQRALITFERPKSAERAFRTMSGNAASSIHVQVFMASWERLMNQITCSHIQNGPR